MEKSDYKPGVATKILGGGIAGVSETIITYPAEFVKTRRQLPQFAGTTSSFAIIKSTYKTAGFTGFYSGCAALATSNALKSGIRFLSFETSKEYLDKVFVTKKGQRNPWVNVLAGFSAGVAESLLVVTPGESLKTRLIQDAAVTGQGNFRGKSLVTVTRLVVAQEGLSALWKGALPVLSKQATNSAVRFTTFGILQEKLAARRPDWHGNIASTLIIGAMSGVVTVYASMPFDNIKTRMQSIGSGYNGMLDCAVSTMRNDGITAFWRGTTPRLVRLTLSSGITFTVYDQIVQASKKFGREQEDELQTL